MQGSHDEEINAQIDCGTLSRPKDDAGTKDETYEQIAGKRLNKARLALGMDIKTSTPPLE
jgi:hypothetical protein